MQGVRGLLRPRPASARVRCGVTWPQRGAVWPSVRNSGRAGAPRGDVEGRGCCLERPVAPCQQPQRVEPAGRANRVAIEIAPERLEPGNRVERGVGCHHRSVDGADRATHHRVGRDVRLESARSIPTWVAPKLAPPPRTKTVSGMPFHRFGIRLDPIGRFAPLVASGSRFIVPLDWWDDGRPEPAVSGAGAGGCG